MVTRETSLMAGLTSLGLLELLPDVSEAARLLGRFSELLTTSALELGLIGPREDDRVVSRHILDSAALYPLISRPSLLVDVGSGAGLPGVVLAILRSCESADPATSQSMATFVGGEASGISDPRRSATQLASDEGDGLGAADDSPTRIGDPTPPAGPDLSERTAPAPIPTSDTDVEWRKATAKMRTILVEPRAKPVAFLRRALRDLGVEYEVLAKRAEDVARSRFREAADHVVARAVAPPSVALELTLPLVAVGGNVLIPVGSLDEAGLSTAARAADELGGAEPVLSRLEVPGADGGRWVMIVQKARSTPERYPRRPGVPRRRPLGGAGVT